MERELSERLRRAPAESRPSLYAEIYDELFRRLEHHPQRTRGEASARATARGEPEIDGRTRAQLRMAEPFVGPDTRFLEIGAGDGALVRALAPRVHAAFAIEVSRAIAAPIEADPRVELFITGGPEIPLPSGAIDLAYSYQLLEHLHPDDARFHLGEVARVLAPGGAYLVATPNRLSGPHDISRHFDREPSGLHIREYTFGELSALLREAGFRRVTAERVVRGRSISIPEGPIAAAERVLSALPWEARAAVARADWVDRALEIYCLARVPARCGV